MPNLCKLISEGSTKFIKDSYHIHDEPEIYRNLVFDANCKFSSYPKYVLSDHPIVKCKFGDGCVFETPGLKFIDCTFGKGCIFSTTSNHRQCGCIFERCSFGYDCVFETTTMYNCTVIAGKFSKGSSISNRDSKHYINKCEFEEYCQVKVFTIGEICKFDKHCEIATSKVEDGCVFKKGCVFLPFRPEDPECFISFHDHRDEGSNLRKSVIVFEEGCIFTIPCKFNNIDFLTHLHRFHHRSVFSNCLYKGSKVLPFLFKESFNLRHPKSVTKWYLYNIDVYGIGTESDLYLFCGLTQEFHRLNYKDTDTTNDKFPVSVFDLETDPSFNHCTNWERVKAALKHFKKLYKIERNYLINKIT